MAKLTDSQRNQIKAVRKEIARERRYIPRGQGDGFNQDLKISNLRWLINQIEAGEDVYRDLVGRGIRF